MKTEQILDFLKSRLQIEAELQSEEISPTILVQAKDIQKIMKFLFAEETTFFDCLMNQTAMHVDDQFRLFWHLFSYKHKHELTIETKVPVARAEVQTVSDLWKIANWLERETYDLFGIKFIGHPDLRRIMLPDDWEGHPLRKDYVKSDNYRDIDNSPSEITKSFIPQEKEKE